MDASDYFTTSVQPLKQNQFGAHVRRPHRKGQDVFLRILRGLPQPPGRNRFRDRAFAPSSARAISLRCARLQGISPADSATIQRQLSTRLLSASSLVSRCRFPNNVASAAIDPTAQNILPFFPLPNSGPNTFITTQTKSETNDQFGRSPRPLSVARPTRLNFRYMFSGGPTTDPLSPAGANVPGFPIGADDRAQNFVAQETHVFSPTVIAVARISYLRNKFLFGEHVNHESLGDLGFQYQPSLAAAAGPPFIQVGGYASVGDPITGPRNTYQNTFDYSGSLSWVRGKHELKFGGGYRHDNINALQGIATNGFFVFAPFPVSPTALPAFSPAQPVFFLQGVGRLFARHSRTSFERLRPGYLQSSPRA